MNEDVKIFLKSCFSFNFKACKKQAHWDRRFYMDDVPQQKLVRHCSPGTIFSKEYCTCIPDMEGLIPVLPGGIYMKTFFSLYKSKRA